MSCKPIYWPNGRKFLSAAVGQAAVANVVLSLSLRGVTGGAAATRAAQEVARVAARRLLLPLLDHAIARLAAVLRRTWHIVVEHAVLGGVCVAHKPSAGHACILTCYLFLQRGARLLS